jgi:SAM-dependent methyltransferase
MIDHKAHWSKIYRDKPPTQVSWYQAHPALSLKLICESEFDSQAPIIDVGAGASTLVDHLIEAGFQNLHVLDISGEALHAAQSRLGSAAQQVRWIEEDITTAVLPESYFAVWHDRAVFHFLKDADVRQRYVAQAARAVRPGGFLIIATFAQDGPEQCSGLDVVRYAPEALFQAFGQQFTPVSSTREAHMTPWDSEQHFIYCCCRLQADNVLATDAAAG